MDLLAGLSAALLEPYASYGFMRRGLTACLALAVGCSPVGVFMVQRRLSLVGDAMAHAVLPGVAVGYLFGGLSLLALTLGGLGAGLGFVCLSQVLSKRTRLAEDASFGAVFLGSLALGVTLISLKGSSVDLMHLLFGNLLAVDKDSLLAVCLAASVSLLGLTVLFRPLVADTLDKSFMPRRGLLGRLTPVAFLCLLVVDLIAGFTTLGTLLCLGMLIVPAVSAMFWTRRLTPMLGVAMGCAALSGYAGLTASYHFDLPAGPSVVLAAGAIFVVSLILGPHGGPAKNGPPRRSGKE